MANFEDGSYSSAPGIALIAKVLAGRCEMRYTRAAVGKGHLGEDESPKTATEPPEYVMDAKIASITNPVDGECQVTVQINSSDVETGFYCTCVILYAEDPDEGEVPYTYLRLEDGPEWIRPASSIVGKLATFDLIAAVGDIDHVEANLDPDAIVTEAAVQQMVTDHNNDSTAHSAQLAQLTQTLNVSMDQKITNAIETSVTEKINESLETISAAGVKVHEITLGIDAWTQLEEAENGYSWKAEFPMADATADDVPQVALAPESMEAAKAAALCGTVEAIDGAVVFLAKNCPTEGLLCTVTLLLQESHGASVTTSSVATATSVGGIKSSDSIIIDEDGTAHAVAQISDESFVSDDEVDDALDDIFGSDEES
jgi:hypothetical protein